MGRKFSNTKLFLYANKTLTLLLVTTLLFSDLAVLFNNPHLPSIQKAHATTGDFAIFRENTGTETVEASSTFPVSWDTTVRSNSNIVLQSNDADIDLSEGGKYFVTYNVWTEEGTSTAGANRRSQLTWLSVGGTDLAYGRGGGYLRDSDNTVYMYNSGAAIIDANAGDDLQVNVRRDELEPEAGTNIRPTTNGVSVLKLKDSWDYLRIYKNASSSDIDGNTSFTDVTWDSSDEVDTGSFGFVPTSGDITLKGDDDDHFLVTTNVKLNKTAQGTRENYEMILTLDGTEIPGTRVTSYLRGTQTGGDDVNDVLVYSGIIKKDAVGDQTLNVEVRRESSASGGTTIIAGGQTALTAVALPDEGSYIMLHHSATSSGASSATAMPFDTQDEVDAFAFSHSTTTNSSRVEIDRAGDYLFFSTAYGVNASNDRQPFRIDWRKNGSINLNYGSHGAYIRGNQSFSGGSSAGIIMNSLTATDYVEITQFDETEAPADLEFQADRVAVQGVLLDENFFGTDVIVSATGTHSVQTDITTEAFYSGGTFVISEKTGSRNITDITLTESGTVDAENGLDNIELYYDFDTTAPYDCASESFSATSTENKFGATDTNGFSGENGVSSFTGSAAISTTQSMCVYVVYDVTASSSDGDTVQISINNPSSDVDGTGSPTVGPITAVGPLGSTTLQNAELTFTHYRWLEDDGAEGSASAVENEDTSATGFANGTIRRLRMQVDAAGSTSSLPTIFQLDYATKTAACNTLTNWVDVGDSGGDWDMSDSSFLVDGFNATNISTVNGGVSDPSGPPTFLVANGSLRDTNSQTDSLTLANDEFVEFEFALEPTSNAPEGTTYCFRVSDQGNELRNYDTYAEGTVSADIDVSAVGSQAASLDVGTTTAYVGGTFVVSRAGGSRTLTDITITETGTVDATNLKNPTLYYDLDTSDPYDCASESYQSSDSKLTGSAFSGANGSTTFSGSLTVNDTQSFCGYVVVDVSNDTADSQTVNMTIENPSIDVVVTSSSVGPSTAVELNGSTTLSGPVLTQTHYHWRNDDGDETDTGATSATGGVEDTVITAVPKKSTRRLRLQVSNESSVSSQATQYVLEYGSKIDTCENVESWINVGDAGGAFDMSTSTFISDGNTTNIDNPANGAMTEENTTFVGTGALREDSATTSGITLSSTQYTEMEFSIEATVDSGYDTTYCFRVADADDRVMYSVYPELTTREKQDFFIQRGTTDVLGTSTTLTAGVDYTAPAATSSAFVRITTSQLTGAGSSTGQGTQGADDVTVYIEDQSDITQEFTFARPTTAVGGTRVDWEIIEYVGLAGADNEMIVRDVGALTYGVSSLNATGSVADGVSDDADVVVFITGQVLPDEGTSNYLGGQSTSEWSASTNEPVFTRETTSGGAAGVSYAVVEFTGLNWQIQRVEHSYTTSGSAETEPINAVNSIARTFLHAQKRTGDSADNGLNDYGHQVWLSSVGNVSFQLEPIANGNIADHFSVAWVVENIQTGEGAMNVNQVTGTLDGNEAIEPRTTSVSMGVTLDTLSNASLFITNDTSGDGIAFPRAMLGATIASTTHIELFESDAGQTQEYRVEIVDWPVAQLAFQQNYYRFYVDNDTLTPTDPWPIGGSSDLGENTSITSGDDPLGEGERVRIRMTLRTSNATLPEGTKSFKLQYGRRDGVSCSAILENEWNDIGAAGSGEIWRGYDGTLTDGAEVPSTLVSVADVAATYEEENNSAVNPNSVAITEDVEFDWLIEHNGATQRSDYCFRMVESDGTLLSAYNNYPTLRTTGYTPIISQWRWFDDATSTTPTWDLAPENSAPIDVADENEIKLRVTVAEVESAPGSNIKFALQYSETSDFSGGVYTLSSSSTCASQSSSIAQLWCYADGGGVDNALIDEAVLSDSDTCTGGTGAGCGTYNEAPTTTSSLAHPSLGTIELEFTLKNDGARANAVYYFRLYDVTNDDPLVASSSYPSLSTEGAQLQFTVDGVASGTVAEGVTADVDTTPTSIPFGTVPPDSEIEALYRLNIDTNATQGYQVLMYASQDLLNAYGEPIAGVSGTNESPLAWSTGCAGRAGCFGYHSGDDVLSGNSTRFAADDTYAAVSTSTPEEVMHSSVPSENTVDIVYKLQITDQQPAGDYETEIVYLAVPTH